MNGPERAPARTNEEELGSATGPEQALARQQEQVNEPEPVNGRRWVRRSEQEPAKEQGPLSGRAQANDKRPERETRWEREQ
ncbi:MAG: hypothetical protein ACJ8M4_00620 [Chthoniobacterales bacterium]